MICPYCELDSIRNRTVSRCPRCHGRIAWRRNHLLVATIILPFYLFVFSLLGRAAGTALLGNYFQEGLAEAVGLVLGLVVGVIYCYFSRHPDKEHD